jgi:hypothetical protein
MPWYWYTGRIGIRQSSAEAEAFAMSECVKSAKHAQYVMEELDIPHSEIIEIGHTKCHIKPGFTNPGFCF